MHRLPNNALMPYPDEKTLPTELKGEYRMKKEFDAENTENAGSQYFLNGVKQKLVFSSICIHMPSLNYQSLGGIQNLWADFEYYGQGENGELLWKLKEYGVNQ
jgi:hypothetical protein